MAQRLNRRRAMPVKKASGPGGPQSKPPSGPGGPQSKPKAKALPRRRAQAVKPKAKASPKAKALPRRRAQAVSKPSKPKRGMRYDDLDKLKADAAKAAKNIPMPKLGKEPNLGGATNLDPVTPMPYAGPRPAPKPIGNSKTKGMPKGVTAPRRGDPNYRRRTNNIPLPRVINDIPGSGMNDLADRRDRSPKPITRTPPERNRIRRRRVRPIDQIMEAGRMDNRGVTRRRYI